MKLDIKTIEALAKGLEKNHLDSLELELGNEKIKLKKKEKEKEKTIMYDKIEKKEITIKEEEKDSKKEKTKEVLSPMLGTFYRSNAPGEEPLVKEGDTVGIGDILCIVEAMKMMNEVKSTEAGVIEKILVEDGIIVQKDEVLFEIK